MANNNASVESEFHDAYDLNSTAWNPFLEQAQLDLDYYHRAQHTEKEAAAADRQGRIVYTIDKLARHVNLLHGYEIRNRHTLKIGPVGGESREDLACNQHTGIIMSLMARHGGYDILSDAFKWGTLIQGSNLIETWKDRNGQVQYGRLGYNQFLLDHGLTKTDLSDCMDIFTGQWLSVEKAKMLVPTRADEIDDIEPLTHSGRWEFQGTPAMMNKAGKRLFEQWWKREIEEVSMVQHRFTGQKKTFAQFAREYANGDKRLANQFIKNFKLSNGMPVLVKFRDIKDKISLKIFVDDKLIWEGDNPLKLRDYNYIWVHGNWCPEAPRTELKLQSYTRGLRDPQRAFNRRINQILDLIESQLQGTRLTRSKYLMNPEDAYLSGQGINLQIDENTPDELPLDQIFKQIPASDVPQSLFSALAVIDKAESEVGGLNQEIFGEDEKNKEISGVLHAYRTGKALTGQAWMFQDFRASKRFLGRTQVQLVQLNYDPNRVRKILNADPVQGFYDEDLARFDCNPTEGVDTDSQRNMFYLELKDLLIRFPDMFAGIITPEMLVKAAPMQFSDIMLKSIQAAQQAKQQASMRAQQLEQASIQLQQGLTAAQIGQAQESMADAQEARSQAPLNRAKTLVEIQKLEVEPLVALVKEQVRLQIAQEKAMQATGAKS